MNNTISEFYISKDKDPDYIKNYDIEHGPRLDAIIKRFNLKELKNQSILDIGGGMGFLEKRLDESNKFIIIDGAELPHDKKLAQFIQVVSDVNLPFENHLYAAYKYSIGTKSEFNYPFDLSFCFEVIEHLENPYKCLLEMKATTKLNGDIYLSVPDTSVTHNTIYPGLIYPVQNFIQFLEQMALPILDYFLFDKGWKTHIFKCVNASWENSKMLFPKQESKFFGKTPLEYTNL